MQVEFTLGISRLLISYNLALGEFGQVNYHLATRVTVHASRRINLKDDLVQNSQYFFVYNSRYAACMVLSEILNAFSMTMMLARMPSFPALPPRWQ